MTPREKAEQLVADFGALALYDAKVDLSAVDIRYAKKCALMVVDEIIAICCYWNTVEEQEFWKLSWGKVKTEIELL